MRGSPHIILPDSFLAYSTYARNRDTSSFPIRSSPTAPMRGIASHHPLPTFRTLGSCGHAEKLLHNSKGKEEHRTLKKEGGNRRANIKTYTAGQVYSVCICACTCVTVAVKGEEGKRLMYVSHTRLSEAMEKPPRPKC